MSEEEMATHVNHGQSRWVTTTAVPPSISINPLHTQLYIEQNTLEDLRTGLLETYGSIIFIFWSL